MVSVFPEAAPDQGDDEPMLTRAEIGFEGHFSGDN
jgi:hypothetical protein